MSMAIDCRAFPIIHRYITLPNERHVVLQQSVNYECIDGRFREICVVGFVGAMFITRVQDNDLAPSIYFFDDPVSDYSESPARRFGKRCDQVSYLDIVGDMRPWPHQHTGREKVSPTPQHSKPIMPKTHDRCAVEAIMIVPSECVVVMFDDSHAQVWYDLDGLDILCERSRVHADRLLY